MTQKLLPPPKPHYVVGADPAREGMELAVIAVFIGGKLSHIQDASNPIVKPKTEPHGS